MEHINIIEYEAKHIFSALPQFDLYVEVFFSLNSKTILTINYVIPIL